jgi:hypothetical protein
VSRIAYRAPGGSNVHPLGAALNLSGEKHSRGLRKLAAIEAARGSVDAAGAAITARPAGDSARSGRFPVPQARPVVAAARIRRFPPSGRSGEGPGRRRRLPEPRGPCSRMLTNALVS